MRIGTRFLAIDKQVTGDDNHLSLNGWDHKASVSIKRARAPIALVAANAFFFSSAGGAHSGEMLIL